MRDIERYLNVRSAYGASLSPSGTLAFLMDTTGVGQVWTLDEPGGWPEQRTFYDEPVGYCDVSPMREELVFGMDEGGNERTQLFRLDLDGGSAVTPLTDHPDAIHYWGGWSHDGDRFAFAANRRDEATFDLHVQDRDAAPGGDTRVYEGESGYLTVGGWVPDDDRLLVSESHSNFDQDLHVFDLQSERLEHVTPHDGDVRFSSGSFGPDGEAVYCVTDRDSDRLYLARLDLDGVLADGSLDAALEPVVEDEEWNVDGVAVDHDTGRLVYSRNVDGYTELTAGEIDGTTVRDAERLDLPRGTAGGVSFDDAGERLALAVSGRTENTNVHLVGDGRERWTRASTAGIDPATFVEPDPVGYETFDGREIPAYFSLPPGVDDEQLPVIVDIHGGPESQRRPSFAALIQYYLANGYAVFEPNVRGSTGYGRSYTRLDDVEQRMDSVRDLRAAVDWLRDRPAVDPDRIVASGGSYGGFMVLAALTEYPELWAAGVDVVGIANFVTFLENTGPWRREHREAEYGSLAEDREFLESISPVHKADRIRAPLFVVHGANDPRVPLEEAEQIAEAAREHVPVELLVFEDEGHGLLKLENRIEAYSTMVEFLDEHV